MKRLVLFICALGVSFNANASQYSTSIIADKSDRNHVPTVVGVKDFYNGETGLDSDYEATIITAVPNSKKVSLNNFKEFGFDGITTKVTYDKNGTLVEDQVNVGAKIAFKNLLDTDLVIFRITGNKGSWMHGDIDNISDKPVDLIIANPNGYVQDGFFRNINDVTFVRDNINLESDGSFNFANAGNKTEALKNTAYLDRSSDSFQTKNFDLADADKSIFRYQFLLSLDENGDLVDIRDKFLSR